MSLFGGGYGQRRGGGGGRLIIGAIIAVIGIVMYMSNTSVNPVTGEKQRVGGMTVEQETALGLQAAPQMAAQMGGEVDGSDPQSQLVRAVGEKIVAQSGASKAPYKFDFHLLADPNTINAFALPGGQVFITRGLLNKLETEAELAGVLGHEIGHVIGRHSAEHMAKGQLGQMLVTATAVGTSDRGGGYSGAMIANVVNQMAQMKFSRADESESDTFGLQFMVEAGYDPRGMLRVMEVLAEAGKGSRQPEFLITHPYPENRIKDIQAYLEKNFPNGVPGGLTTGRDIRVSPARFH